MDFSSTYYDVPAYDNYFTSVNDSEVLSVEQTNSVLNQLLSTIELSTLGAVFFGQLKKFLPISAVDMSELGDSLRFGTVPNPESLTVISLKVSTANTTSDASKTSIHYVFATEPDAKQRRLMATLHQLFDRPLQHALEFQRLKFMATKDPLTGLGNRNGFNEACNRTMHLSRRRDATFGLIVLDLDNFKQVNDKFGHLKGDEVLRTVASLLSKTIRSSEEAFRFGGDEFCCIVDTCSANTLGVVAERLRVAITSDTTLQQHGISCSLGGALFRYEDDIASLFSRADNALYQAKNAGKNLFQAA